MNLMKFGTTFITIGSQQDLVFDPGEYSIRYDGVKFVPEVSFSSSSRNFPFGFSPALGDLAMVLHLQLSIA